MPVWNPWHGCTKYSEGCKNCYVYRRDSLYGKDSSVVTKNSDFDLPIRKNRDGLYKMLTNETVYVCMTSDFFLDKADCWRSEIWDIIRRRCDLNFMIITKRIERFSVCLPDDWGDGWDNVSVTCTCENQKRADFRLPIFVELPIKHKSIACEPLLERINIEKYLEEIDLLVAGGESGENARICDFDWICDLKRQCESTNTEFYFKQTGARFVKDGKLFRIPRKIQHIQAQKAKINTVKEDFKL
ncbi:MAG: DUF5131 family protein [Oscillospiraceae bacterium]|nr:DUF5131 family protein [Oscillospiraceae bacterium]